MAKGKHIRAMTGCSEQYDRWHKASIPQTNVVLTAANDFCVIWCCVYFRLGDHCVISALSLPSHAILMIKKRLFI